MPSVLSRVLVLYLRASGRKRVYRDAARFRAAVEAERRTVRHEPPADLVKHIDVQKRSVAGMPVYALSPRGRDTRDTARVVYLHGGCYVFEITPHHWRFCAWLATQLGAEVSVPIYPLAPERAASDVLPDVTEVLLQTRSRHVVLMGDSAGGGMALAVAQQLKARGARLPDRIVLLSPWVDVSMTNPAIPAVDAVDPWLSAPGLREAGRLYARGLSATDPRVSPIHGDLAGLGSIAIFIGTHDVLLPDAQRLATSARAAGTEVSLFEYPSMVHDFMLIPALPEARAACRRIAEVSAGSAP